MALKNKDYKPRLNDPKHCPHERTTQIEFYDRNSEIGYLGQVQIGYCPDCDSFMLLDEDNCWYEMEIKK